jgi:hypothetical protein
MAKVKTKPAEPGSTAISSYNGLTGEATWTSLSKVYGPVKVSVPDYHTINAAMSEARREGGLKAAREIKDQIDATVRSIFNRWA